MFVPDATAGYFDPEKGGGVECHVRGANVKTLSEGKVWVALAEGQRVGEFDVSTWTSVDADKVCLRGCEKQHKDQDGNAFWCSWQVGAATCRGMTRRITITFGCLDLVSEE